MMLVLDHHDPRAVPDTLESPRPRSLALALGRMGFARRIDNDTKPRWPHTWSRPQRDENALDWRPV